MDEKSFLGHLEDLRRLIIKIGICLLILLPAAYWMAEPLIRFLIASCTPEGFTLKYFSPMEPFFVRIKAAFMLSLFFGLPYIAFQTWKFVVPGLYVHERFWLGRLTLLSWVLFTCGVLFCYWLIIPAVMRFSLSLRTDILEPAIGIGNFIELTGMLLIGFGIMFQFPIAVFILTGTGMVRLHAMKKQRPAVLIIILTLSALLTPPDVFSQLAMAIPTYLLFECSLLLAAIAVKEKPRKTVGTENITSCPEPASDNSCHEPDQVYHQAARPSRRKLRSCSVRRVNSTVRHMPAAGRPGKAGK